MKTSSIIQSMLDELVCGAKTLYDGLPPEMKRFGEENLIEDDNVLWLSLSLMPKHEKKDDLGRMINLYFNPLNEDWTELNLDSIDFNFYDTLGAQHTLEIYNLTDTWGFLWGLYEVQAMGEKEPKVLKAEPRDLFLTIESMLLVNPRAYENPEEMLAQAKLVSGRYEISQPMDKATVELFTLKFPELMIGRTTYLPGSQDQKKYLL